MEIRTEKVNIVLNDDCVKKVFSEREYAEAYAEKMTDKSVHESAQEYNFDEDTEEGLERARVQNGFEGGIYGVGELEIPVHEEDDEQFVEGRDDGEDFEVSIGGLGDCTVSLQEIRECMHE